MSARDLPQQDEIAAALTYIPAHDRDTWVRMAMAIKSELGEAGFSLWDDWSQSADTYHTKSAKAVWKGIKAGGKVTIASLFHEAKANGWKPSAPYMPPTPEQRAALEAERQAAALEAAEIERQQREAAKTKAARLWNEARDVAADHPYLVAKGVMPEGAKQLRQMLVLPIKAGGELVNLQLIGTDGSKRFLTGGQVKGGSLVLGKLAGATEAILCEGWATGLSLRAATELPVIVAFNAGNLPVIAERLFKSLPEMALIVAGDTDASQVGQQAAKKAAQAHSNARWCCPSFTPNQITQRQQTHSKAPSDFNDLHQLAGLEEVARQIENASQCGAVTDNSGEVNLKEISPPAADEDAYIRHLAGLSLLEYGRQRKAAAEALGDVPLGILDKLVNAARKEMETGTGGSGASIVFDDVEPWPVPVDGAAVLGDAYALLCRYVIADRETLRAAALWSALTWFADAATVLPLALITAPEKGCGKSTLLSALAKLASRPLWASNVTPAALFRAVESWKPSLFIDEADTFMRDNPELVGIINSGHTRDTAYVIRTVGDEHEPKVFSTWGAKAISGIGAHGMAETITSRSIVLTMRRKLPGERCDNLRHADRDAFHAVKRQLARWADDHRGAFSNQHPTLDGLSNRTADNWEPLLALADLAGGEWPKQARHTAMKITGSEEDAPSLNQELLGDIRAVFDRLKVDRINTATLLDELCKDDESAWSTYNRGKPVTPRQLSKRLTEFGIKPGTVRAGFDTAKGYKREQFSDAFSRYLDKGGDLSVTPSQPNNGAASRVTDSGFHAVDKAVSVTRKPSIGGGCDVVTDEITPKPEEKKTESIDDWLNDYAKAEQGVSNATEYF